MPFAQVVNTVVWNEETATWVPGNPTLLTKNSFTRAIDIGPRTQVWLNDGSYVVVNADLTNIETFLNS